MPGGSAYGERGLANGGAPLHGRVCFGRSFERERLTDHWVKATGGGFGERRAREFVHVLGTERSTAKHADVSLSRFGGRDLGKCAAGLAKLAESPARGNHVERGAADCAADAVEDDVDS